MINPPEAISREETIRVRVEKDLKPKLAKIAARRVPKMRLSEFIREKLWDIAKAGK